MNSVVSFELAKLLRERGYETFTSFEYDHGANLIPRSYCSPHRLCSAPTIAEVVMWLYEKHGIWVSVNHSRSLLFYPYIYKNGEQVEGGEYSYDLISEAYETSIEYVLKNLI